VSRDDDFLREGVEKWLGREIVTFARPTAGYSCETVVIDETWVFRFEPAGDGIFPLYSFPQHVAAQNAVAAVGIPTAAPVRYVEEPQFFGEPFVVMPFVAGPIPNDFTPIDPWLAGLPDDAARRRVWESTIDTVAGIHRVSPIRRWSLEMEFKYWAAYLVWMGDAPAELADAFNWCRKHAPTDEPEPVLLWGDVRFGNIVYDEATLVPKAVLDWDMTSTGPPEMDIAWLLALDQVGAELTGMSVSGFGAHDEAVARFEQALGRSLVDLDWFEIFALVRAGAISTRITILKERAGGKPMFKPGEDPTLAAALQRIG
jgi:aminoglycoside phosphotransferase (APT) family kinase protein